MFLRVRFILTVKTQGILLPGSANGLPHVSRASYQHRQDLFRVSSVWGNCPTDCTCLDRQNPMKPDFPNALIM